MSVVVVGLQHRRTSLDVLERVRVTEAEAPKVRAALRDCVNLQEAILVSTCLRTEVFAVVDRFHDAVAEIEGLLAARAGVEAEVLAELADVRFDEDVATHLFRVASGLESAVPGESEVLGQVKRSWEQARQDGICGPVLGDLFRHAVHTGKRVRSETTIGRGTTSFSHAAVNLARERRPGGLAGSSVVVAGTGAMGEGVLSALVGRPDPEAVARVLLVSRHRRSAEALVARLMRDGRARGVHMEAAPLDGLGLAVGTADVVFTALDAEQPVLGPASLGAGRPERPLLLVDMGLPRNVEGTARSVPGLTVLDLEDIRTAVDEALEGRQLQLDAAEAVIAEEVGRYRMAARARGAAPVVAALRSRVEELRRSELERRRGQHGELSEAEWALVDEVTRSVVAKLFHEPTVALKDAAGTPRGERLVESLRLLFDL